jgi:hypothetical protein
MRYKKKDILRYLYENFKNAHFRKEVPYENTVYFHLFISLFPKSIQAHGTR